MCWPHPLGVSSSGHQIPIQQCSEKEIKTQLAQAWPVPLGVPSGTESKFFYNSHKPAARQNSDETRGSCMPSLWKTILLRIFTPLLCAALKPEDFSAANSTGHYPLTAVWPSPEPLLLCLLGLQVPLQGWISNMHTCYLKSSLNFLLESIHWGSSIKTSCSFNVSPIQGFFFQTCLPT